MYGLSGKPFISLQSLKFLNRCILFNIGPINTKLQDFVKLRVLFLNIWFCVVISHNTRTGTQAPTV